MPKGVRHFNLQFINKIKNKGTNKAFKKLQLIIQAYNNLEKELVLTQLLTIQQVSQRLILYIAAMLLQTRLYFQDISQAYI